MSEQNTIVIGAPKAASLLSYLVGQDKDGHWLVVEQHGLGGGFFRSREAALSYVRFETHRAPGQCLIASGTVDLQFGAIEAAPRRAKAA